MTDKSDKSDKCDKYDKSSDCKTFDNPNRNEAISLMYCNRLHCILSFDAVSIKIYAIRQ